MARHLPPRRPFRPAAGKTSPVEPTAGDPADQPSRPPRAWQPRFSMGNVLLAMAVLCVASACGYYAVRAFLTEDPGQRRTAQAVFIIFVVASPAIVVVGAHLFRWLWKRFFPQ